MDFTQENFDKLQADLVIAQDRITELETENTNLTDKVIGLADQLAEKETEITALVNAPTKKEDESMIGKVFEYNGEKYKLKTNGMRIPGLGKMTALEIATSEKAMEALINSKSEMLVKVV